MLRLGLDVGTNSIGWCLVETDGQIVDIGVRIFADGRDPKSGASLAVDRRVARAIRRRRDRYLGRREAILSALTGHGLMPADTDLSRLVAKQDPYHLRARALDARLEPEQIGRAIFHLNQRRGFKSNRKADRRQKDAEDGKIASAAKALDLQMGETGCRTLGEFLYKRLQDGQHARVRMGSDNQGYDFYPERRHIEAEFDAIWDAQVPHHTSLLTEAARENLKRILFFQRPLKEQEVGVCTFITAERRLPKAHPLFQARRLYEEVNQLEVTTPGAPARKLTKEERDRLILKLQGVKAASFDSLARLLKLEPGQSFNKASETRTQLAGDEVFAVMSDKKRFGSRWAQIPAEQQWEILQRLQDEEDPEALKLFFVDTAGLTEEQADATARAPLPEGFGRLGPTATRLILEEHQAAVITYDEAVRRVAQKDPRFRHHSDFRTGECLDRLPYYGELLNREIPPGTLDPNDPEEVRWGKITNPTVHIGLRQLEKLVNAVIAVHGKPDQIVVELARELKLSERQKEEHNRRIRDTTRVAALRSEKLQELGVPDTGANRMLLRQWEELNPKEVLDRRCPYCAEPIGVEQLFNGTADIDHIIPYSRSLDDSPANKILAHRSCNRTKGNRTPWEAWGGTGRWDLIVEQASRLHRSKQWRFQPDAMARVETDGGFLSRQLTDTQYLARLARNYLSSLYASAEEGSVYVIPGRMTAMLRRLWGLNSLLPDHNFVENQHSDAPKNRLDHRHHAIDAAVVAITTRGLLQQIARAAGRAEERDLDRLFEDLEQPWPGFREELGDRLSRVVVSHKPDHGRKGRPAPGRDITAGRLHNETAYGLTGKVAADGRTPVVVHRVSLASLKPADLMNPDRIPDPVLRTALVEATRGLSGKEFEQALGAFSKEGWHHEASGRVLFKGIRRVRAEEPLNVIQIRDRAGMPFKAYKGDANARFDVWRLPNGKWVSDIVSMFDAHQTVAMDRRPHPAARKVLSLRQNDMLAIQRHGGPVQIVRVVKFSGNGQIALAAANEAGALKTRDATPNEIDPFKYVLSSAGGLQSARARQVRVDPLGRVFDPGPREPTIG